MGTSSGPKEPTRSNLIFCADSQDIVNSATALGAGDWNGHNEGIKDRISQVIASFNNGVRLAGRDYYTAIAIDYPESSYGGDAASRHGITPGYNVRSGGKVFDYGRALNYAVWDNKTSAWVKFTVYDTYAYSSEVDRFVTEYAQTIVAYPDATHIVAGSHRDSNHSEPQYEILRSLGAPNNVNSIIGFSSPEWILVGKPGLRAGNAYGWAFQNYPTNPDQVAHLNFGLPIKPRGGWLFDGSNDFVSFPSSNVFDTQTVTVEVVVKPAATNQTGFWFEKGAVNTQYSLFMENSNIVWRTAYGGTYDSMYFGSSNMTANAWNHVVGTYTAGNKRVYLNNTLMNSSGLNVALNTNQGAQFIGSYNSGGYHYNGEIGIVKVYNKALTAEEIAKNYANYKTRFNLP
jgi:hypothetical protein